MIALPLFEMLELIVTGLGFIGAVLFFRIGTKKGWYLSMGKDEHGVFEIPKEAMEFNNRFLTEEYATDLLKRAIVAMVWFFFSFLILMMASIGGNTITESNPLFKLPCIILLLIMQFVCIWKLLMFCVQIVDDYVLSSIGVVIIARTIEKEPLCIKMPRSRSAIKKDIHNLIEEPKKEVATNV